MYYICQVFILIINKPVPPPPPTFSQLQLQFVCVVCVSSGLMLSVVHVRLLKNTKLRIKVRKECPRLS